MSKLDGVSAEELRTLLDGVEDPKAVKRLVVALDYKDGVQVAAMSERYGIPRSTLYYWLDRFESEPPEEAIRDDPRPGRPPELDDSQRDALEDVLAEPPASAGYDAEAWSPDLIQAHLEDAFGVSYSVGHVRRLLREFRGE